MPEIDPRLLDAAALRRFVPLDGLSEAHLDDILRRARVRELPRGRILFKRGSAGGVLHFLLEGAVDLADARFAVRAVRSDDEGAQQALDDSNPHACTCVATCDARVLEVDRDHLDLVRTWNRAGNYLVTELDREEAMPDDDWMSSLLQAQVFAAVPPANIQRLFARFEAVAVSSGQAIVRQGEPGAHFYVLKKGVARIQRRMARDGMMRDLVIADLGPGDVFGEDALISDAPRNATVVMRTDGEVMRLGKADFRALLSDPVLREIRYAELLERLRDPGQRIEVLDVRLPLEYRRGHLPGSRSMPLHGMRRGLRELDPDTLYVTTCNGGRRASLASFILSEHGFESLVLVDPPAGSARAS